MFFHVPKKSLVKNFNEIETETMVIKRGDVVTYPEVPIDENLTLNVHVEYVRT